MKPLKTTLTLLILMFIFCFSVKADENDMKPIEIEKSTLALSYLYSLGVDGDVDFKKAYFNIQEACEFGDSRICGILSTLKANQDYNNLSNEDKMFIYHSLACKDKIYDSCITLEWLEKHKNSDTKSTADEIYESACELGYNHICDAYKIIQIKRYE